MADPAQSNSELTKFEPLNKINIVSYRWLTAIINYLPLFLFLYVFVSYFYFPRTNKFDETRLDEIQLTGFAMMGVIIIASGVVFQKASSIINTLWQTGIFQEELKSPLVRFSKRIEALANHRIWQIAIIVVIIMIASAGTIYSCSVQNATGLNLLFCNYHKGWIRTSKSLLEMVTFLSLALLVWRIFVVTWSVRQLGKTFDFNLIWNHPDDSGGLSPVGTLCFWVATITAIPATFLGTWLILCSNSDTSFCSNFLRIESRLYTFQQTLFIVIVLSLISFVWPLWSTHAVMQRKKEMLRLEQLSSIGQKIDQISKQLAINANQIMITIQEDSEQNKQDLLTQSEGLEKKLEFLRRTYTNLDKLPVWPFHKGTVIKLASSQGIPLLGLTGIGSNILGVLQTILQG